VGLGVPSENLGVLTDRRLEALGVSGVRVFFPSTRPATRQFLFVICWQNIHFFSVIEFVRDNSKGKAIKVISLKVFVNIDWQTVLL
jgi:hypothetical protein